MSKNGYQAYKKRVTNSCIKDMETIIKQSEAMYKAQIQNPKDINKYLHGRLNIALDTLNKTYLTTKDMEIIHDKWNEMVIEADKKYEKLWKKY